MSRAFYCGICDGEPQWRITRIGDVVTSWACDEHLATECHRLQRDWEVTELSVQHQPKLREVNAINRALEAIAVSGASDQETPDEY